MLVKLIDELRINTGKKIQQLRVSFLIFGQQNKASHVFLNKTNSVLFVKMQLKLMLCVVWLVI